LARIDEPGWFCHPVLFHNRSREFLFMYTRAVIRG
jgi:hypothetical protein